MVWLVVVILGGVVVLNVLAFNHARAMMKFSGGGERTHTPAALTALAKMRVLLTGVSNPRPMSGSTPSEVAEDCQEVTIPGEDGITLGGWYCNRGADTPLVILFHGYCVEKSALLDEARGMLGLGVSVLMVDFRGSGASSESHTTMGADEADDVVSAVGYARARLAHAAVVVFGQSMGAAAILRAVDVRGLQLDGAILEAIYGSLMSAVRNRFALMGVPAFPSAELLMFWGTVMCRFNGFRINPTAYARSLRCPSLFLHGDSDSRAKLAEGERVFGAASGEKQMVVFKGVDHESYLNACPEQWRECVGAFLAMVTKQKT